MGGEDLGLAQLGGARAHGAGRHQPPGDLGALVGLAVRPQGLAARGDERGHARRFASKAVRSSSRAGVGNLVAVHRRRDASRCHRTRGQATRAAFRAASAAEARAYVDRENSGRRLLPRVVERQLPHPDAARDLFAARQRRPEFRAQPRAGRWRRRLGQSADAAQHAGQVALSGRASTGASALGRGRLSNTRWKAGDSGCGLAKIRKCSRPPSLETCQ